MKFTLEQIKAATSGEILQGLPTVLIRGVSTNSKTIKRGELFIAIRGERFDAHDFLDEVARRGAVAVVVSRKDVSIPPGMAAVKVDDTVKALGHIARAYRDRFMIPVIGITGSAGKTTTKEMIAHVLKAKYRVLKNSGTENNHIGVPLTLLRIKPYHDLVIVEMGTNRFGDIPWLVEVARPTMAVLTNIGASHLAELKSPSDVFREKASLIRAIAPGGIVVLNKDDPFLRKAATSDRRHRVVTYGIQSAADYQGKDIEIDAWQRIHFRTGPTNSFILKVPVPAFVYNALVAITCGRVFKINYNRIKERIATFRPQAGRQRPLRLGKFQLIDDSYNANPVSFRCALETLSAVNVKGRRIVACADMLELGEQAEELHQEVGRFAALKGIDAIFSFGKFSRLIGEAAKEKDPAIAVFHAEDLSEVQNQLVSFCRSGDAILVKGSRGMRMERLIDVLKRKLA